MFITNIIVFTILVIPDIITISDISTTMYRLPCVSGRSIALPPDQVEGLLPRSLVPPHPDHLVDYVRGLFVHALEWRLRRPMRTCLLRWRRCCSSCHTGLPLAIRRGQLLGRHSPGCPVLLVFPALVIFFFLTYISGTTNILPGLSPYLLSPITSFHHIGYP